ncbi:conserved hypothetical protein, partial [Ricinus communis]
MSPRSGGSSRCATKVASIARQILACESTSVPSQSNTARRLVIKFLSQLAGGGGPSRSDGGGAGATRRRPACPSTTACGGGLPPRDELGEELGMPRSLRPPHQRDHGAAAPCLERVGGGQAGGVGLVLAELERAAPGPDLQAVADDRSEQLRGLGGIDLVQRPFGLGREAAFLLVADRAQDRAQAGLVGAGHLAFELDRDIVPGRHLVRADAVPVRAHIGVGALQVEQRGGAVEMAGEAVAAREVEAERVVAQPHDRHMRDSGAVG